MTLEELKETLNELKTFVKAELEKVKELRGFNAKTIKDLIGIIKEVVDKIDDYKTKFEMTNEEAQKLAVEACRSVIDKIFTSYLGKVGRFIYSMLPSGLKDQLAKVIVDTVVAIVHNYLSSKKASKKAKKSK